MKNRISLIVTGITIAIISGLISYYSITKRTNAEKIEHDIEISNNQYRYNQRLSDYIGFDSIQQASFIKLEVAYRNQIKELRSELMLKERLLIEEMQNKKADTKQMRKYSSDIGKLHSKIKDSTIDHFIEVKKLCTEEQEDKIVELFTKYGNRYNQERLGMGRNKREQNGNRRGMRRNMREFNN